MSKKSISNFDDTKLARLTTLFMKKLSVDFSLGTATGTCQSTKLVRYQELSVVSHKQVHQCAASKVVCAISSGRYLNLRGRGSSFDRSRLARRMANLDTLQDKVDHIPSWMAKNELSLHIGETELVHFLKYKYTLKYMYIYIVHFVHHQKNKIMITGNYDT